MNRPYETDEPIDPRLNRLAEGEAPADVQSRAREALAGLREKMNKVETEKESFMKTLISNRWARLGWAGSLAAVVVFVFVMVGPGSKSGVAFADVAARLRTAQTMVYTIIMKMEGLPPEMQKHMNGGMDIQVSYKQPGLMRMNMMDGSIYSVMDTRTRKGISVTGPQKTYINIDATSISANQFNPTDAIEKMRTLPERADKDLGTKEIDGRRLWGFMVHENATEMTVWADPKTGDPVVVEMTFDGMKGVSGTMKDFQFDVPLDDKLFDTTPPAGYTRQEMKLVMPTEQDLLLFLDILAGLDPANEFPPDFSPMALMQSMIKLTKSDKAKKDEIPPAVSKFFGGKKKLSKEERMQLAMKTGRGAQFPMMLQQKGGEWHYAGAGIKRGDPSPIAWWKEKDAKSWRVIYGDLKIGDMPLEDMAKLQESVKKINAQTSTTATRR
ncbi:hypothetical protein LLG95_12310 [bacterium]|nr:hypothetical protein [bacterium]